MTAARRLPRCNPHIHTQELGDELVLVNPLTQEAHHLTGAAAEVWQAARAGQDVNFSDDKLELLVAGLVDLGLLVPDNAFSRRALLMRAGVVGAGALALAGVTSMALPELAAAYSVSGTTMYGPGSDGMAITVTSQTLYFTVIGAGGGGGTAAGGAGGVLSGTYMTNGSAPLTLYIGSGGGGATGTTAGTAGASGFAAGGAGSALTTAGGGGGGASALYSPNLEAGVVVAGGGGGGGAVAGTAGSTTNNGSGTARAGGAGLLGGGGAGGGCGTAAATGGTTAEVAAGGGDSYLSPIFTAQTTALGAAGATGTAGGGTGGDGAIYITISS